MTTMTHTPQVPHRWVKHTVTNVTAVPDVDDDRQIVVIEDPDDIEAAEEGAVYGCTRCDISMPGNTDSLCPVDPMCHCGVNLSEHGATENHNFVEMT